MNIVDAVKVDTGYVYLKNNYAVGNTCITGMIGKLSNGELLNCVSGHWSKLGESAVASTKSFLSSTTMQTKSLGNYKFCTLQGQRETGDDGVCRVFWDSGTWYVRYRASPYTGAGTGDCYTACID